MASDDRLAEAIDRMAAIAGVVNQFNETDLQVRAFETLTRELFGARDQVSPLNSGVEDRSSTEEESQGSSAEGESEIAAGKTPAKKTASKRTSSRKMQFVIPKDIHFAPEGKQSLRSFIEEKNPSTNQEKMLVAAYYLKHTLERKVTAGDVMAVFVSLDWKKPADPINALQVVASLKGWFDTKSMDDIGISWKGETYVQDSLPKPSK